VSNVLAPGVRVAGAALATFVAGVLLGHAWGHHAPAAAETALDPALAGWALAADSALDLSREQAADLRILLAHYARERDHLLTERLAEADSGWLELDRRFEGLILNRILEPEQRARAERLFAGGPLAPLPPSR
jgi:hypothetical protein